MPRNEEKDKAKNKIKEHKKYIYIRGRIKKKNRVKTKIRIKEENK
jgi:hypothetical protein